MQSHYYDSSSGQYNGGELWTDANTLEDLHNLMLATGNDNYGAVADSSYIGKAALNSGTNWNSFIGGSFDDAQWVILALWKIADYKSARGLDGGPFTRSAAAIYSIIEAQWDTGTCGGGVWWSSADTYKNSITNELFLLTSAQGYLRGGGQTYLDNANKEWAWLSSSGLRNSQGLYNDGLNSGNPSACTNNGQTTWTYNQGVVASGLANLYAATGNSALLTAAEVTLDATISLLTTNDILKESCDDAASGGAVCNNDQTSFKGIWVKHLQYYLDSANDATRTTKYSPFLGSQYSAVVHYGTNGNDDIGSVWYAPSSGGSQFTPESSGSGLAAIVAAAKYGPC